MPGLGGIGPGTHRLGLQGRLGPILVHLVGHHALHVVLDIHHVDDRQRPILVAAVLKAAGVLVTLAPSLRVPPYGPDPEAIAVVAEAVEHIAALRLRHNDAVSGAGGAHGDGGLLRLVQVDELPVLVVIAELVPGAHGVFQIGGFQGGGAPADAHLQGIIHHGGGRNRRQAEQSDDKQKGQSVLFHKTSQCRIP